MTRGGGTYYDGRSARPHPVALRLSESGLEIEGPEIGELWPLADLVSHEAAPPILRLGRAEEPARLETEDAAFAAQLRTLVPDLDRRGRHAQRGYGRLVFWSIAAGVSVLLVTIFAVPAIATRLAPLVPVSIEARIGNAVEDQVVRLLGVKRACTEPAAKAILDRLVARMTEGADLPAPILMSVRSHKSANALTLPGGRVMVLSELIDDARTPDELAAVLAHEFGHVANRDPIRSLLAASGTSFLLSLILGDLTGSTIIVALGQAAISAGYSRDAERAADAYAVAMMQRAGGDPAALASILERIDDEAHAGESATDFLRSHPYTKERAATIRAMAGESGKGRQILSDAEWQSLRGICKTSAK